MGDQNRDNDGKVKETLERDLDQTKADLTGDHKGRDLDQDVDDTVRQAAGKQPIPPENTPNRD